MPFNPQAAMQKARHSERDNKLADAEQIYRNVVQQDPSYAPAYHALGLLAYRVENLPLAIEIISSAILLAENPSYYRDRGEMKRRIGNIEGAIDDLTQAVSLAPDNADGHYNFGLALAANENYTEAIASYLTTTKLQPDHSNAYNNMGSALEKLGNRDAAEIAYKQAIMHDTNNAEAHNNLGQHLSEKGHITQAIAHLDKAINLLPHFISAHQHLSHLKTYQQNDPHFHLLKSLANNIEQVPETERTILYFALAKAYDDTGDYKRAFDTYKLANKLHHQKLPNYEPNLELQAKSIVSNFTRSYIEKSSNTEAGVEDNTPIFIVGMPRSGTTLVEQIISSHKNVYGAGELKYLHEAIQKQIGDKPLKGIAAKLTSLPTEGLNAIANTYLTSLSLVDSTAPRITDKMPGNFFYLGLIHLIMPNAKIIHCMRDPMDSCLSNYVRLFNDTMDFTYDLSSLGRYYNRYMDIMNHWHTVLPVGAIHNIRYEDTVRNTEETVRNLIEHLDLEWDEHCLDFHNNKRKVKTASFVQVRKPIYQNSVSGWLRYEDQLLPLLEIVNSHRQIYLSES
jgi:tetratricopeptide (TPR) repeat protein